LSSYKKDGLSKQIERKHLIKRRDILNISKKYNINIILPKTQQPSKKKKKYENVQEKIGLQLVDPSSNTVETNKRHFIASQLSLSFVNPIHENVWSISMENSLVSTHSSNNCNKDVYNVTKNDVICCSGDCESYCTFCNICYHSYTCTCSDFISKKIICEHVHLTVCFQANPNANQYENHIERPFYGNQDHTTYTKNCPESLNPQPTKNVQLGNESKNLKNVKLRLEKLMMDTLKKISQCNNSDLLENLEKQITNLSTDLLQETTKKRNEIQTIITPEKNIEVYYVY